MVAVDRVESDPLPVLSGVPQGSVLGPLIFLIYINDLQAAVADTSSCLNLFADDVLLYWIITCASDYLLQQMIHHIEQWSAENYLDFNSSKCKFIVVSHKRDPIMPEASLLLFGNALEQVSSYKYLGVLLTGDLSWSLQIESVCQKA